MGPSKTTTTSTTANTGLSSATKATLFFLSNEGFFDISENLTRGAQFTLVQL